MASLGRQEEAEQAVVVEWEGTCLCGSARWRFCGELKSATACNCTLCRRYGALWAYGYEGAECTLEGPTTSFTRVGKDDPALEILFCPSCACVLCWRGVRENLKENGRQRMAVNLRLADPDTVASLAIDHFDGLVSFDDLPSDGRCVKDLWF